MTLPFENIRIVRSPSPPVLVRGVTGLDGAYPLDASDEGVWAVNPGEKEIARLLLDLVIRATTGRTDDPVLNVRPMTRVGGASGYVAAGDGAQMMRPRLTDDPTKLRVLLTTDGGLNYTDHSVAATDTSTAITMNSLGTLAQGVHLLVGGPKPFCGAAIDNGSSNSNSSVHTVEYWNGTGWTTVSNRVGASANFMSADQQVTWSMPAAGLWRSGTFGGLTAYWTRHSWSVALDSSSTINQIDLLYPIKAALDVQADGDDVALMLESVYGGVTGTPVYEGSLYVSWR